MAAAADADGGGGGGAVDKHCINCWSGPRCCSTSLMYSFAQRSDTQVLDEPLYASFVATTGLHRPYRDLLLASQENDAHKVAATILGPRARPVLYAKQMAKHKLGLDQRLWRRAAHVLLVREPVGVIQSFSKALAPSLLELGYGSLLEIFSELRAMGRPPLVVLSDELVRHPEPMLRALCAALELPFQPAMLHWSPGPKPYDGCWAPWWYANTHKGTGFDFSYRDAREPLPDRLKPLLGECWPSYELLRRHALRPLPPDAVPRPLGPARSQHGLRVAATAASSSSDAAAEALSSLARVSLSSSPAADATATPRGSAAAGAAGAATAAAAAAAAPSTPRHQQQQQQQQQQQTGTHAVVPDARNADVLVGISDGSSTQDQHRTLDLVWRPQAKVSVLDSGFLLGDGLWEGLRLHRGVVAFARAHLARLYDSAKAIDMRIDLTPKQLLAMVYQTVDANGMAQASGVHVRLVVSRGLKATPYQHPKVTVGRPTVVVLPEWKEAAPGPKERGIRLFTVHVRRGPPDVQDPALNSLSKLNCIGACIQAAKAGADEALMLDPHGFVSTCNSVNFFVVREGEVWAPRGGHMMRGVTRAVVMRVCREQGLPVRECDFYLTQVYSADEAFCTGTFAGVLPVVEVDGRAIGDGARGALTAQLQVLYAAAVEADVARGRGLSAGGGSGGVLGGLGGGGGGGGGGDDDDGDSEDFD